MDNAALDTSTDSAFDVDLEASLHARATESIELVHSEHGDVDLKTRARRERKRQQRYDQLHAMTMEERKLFIYKEDHGKDGQVARLERVLADGMRQVKLAIDLRYDEIMNEKEIHSLAKQLKLVYGSVKAMEDPFQLRFFQCSPPLRQSLARFSAEKWVVRWQENGQLTDVVPATDVVYLSPDSPNVLTTLDASKMYVIGGIVDKSRKKGATLQTAESAGITTARLPIQEYITERLDHILNVNTVVDVLIHFHSHGDWQRALTEVLPLRKQKAVGRQSIKRKLKRSTEQEQAMRAVEDEMKEAATAEAAVEDAKQVDETSELIESLTLQEQRMPLNGADITDVSVPE